MISAHPQPDIAPYRPPEPVLEIFSQKGTAPPLLVPVTIHSLSPGGVTLGVTSPLMISAWERLRGQQCILNLDHPDNLQPFTINAKISWVKTHHVDRSTVSLGLQLDSPSREVLKHLSDHLVHTPGDIKGLWEKYDQAKETPAPSRLVQYCYIGGLVLLGGGLLLQMAAPPPYKILGWGFWLLGSLGIALKVMRSFRHKRGLPSPDGEKPREI